MAIERSTVRCPEDGYEVTLLSGERLVSCQRDKLTLPDKPANAMRYLAKLAQVDDPGKIGKNGPLVAAAATEGNESAASQGLYEVAFGRDSLISAEALGDIFPELVDATLIYWAQWQGVRESIYDEQDIGRICHELRSPEDPVAQQLSKKLHWQWPFYATVDATLHFVRIFCRRALHEGRADPEFLGTRYFARNGAELPLRRAFELAVQWIFRRMGTNPEGFIESKRKFPTSHAIQAMEDSWDSHHHKNGDIPNFDRGVVSVEVQAYAWEALVLAAKLYEALGYESAYAACLDAADRLRESMFKHLWFTDERGGFFACGGDRDENGEFYAFRIRKASAGELLRTGILDREREKVDQMTRMLMSRNMLCASGLRTLADFEGRFRPGSYHNGSSWPFKTFLVAQGLERVGRTEDAYELYRRVVDVVRATRIYPELTRGDTSATPSINEHVVDVYDEANGRENRIEQPPQLIQAWTVAAVVNILHRAAHDLNFARNGGFLGDPLIVETGVAPAINYEAVLKNGHSWQQ